MGGQPSAVAGFVWPTRDGAPLPFLAQIDLAQLHACAPISWLPKDGVLLFFYDVATQPWGIEPDERSGWQVVFAPEGPRQEIAFPRDLPTRDRLTHQFLDFHAIRSFPSSQRQSVERLRLSDAEADAYFDQREQQFSKTPHHQVGGYPIEIQNDDMELEAELLSSGIPFSQAPARPDARADATIAAEAAWRLLFQIDSDEHSGTMWGDAGMLYFWVRASDAVQGRFERTWLVLQCH
jgi:uncharacterized protein YwqG